ncbi:bifunctional riboflavin kinase/FAD synthetase [Salibacteraceae bacterium]|nr:bifunctional riboflavin kinase/FAD synthetase [Salibacteraceae bacterium]
MKIFRGIEAYESNKTAYVTTGTFDGVHIGHKKILKQLSETAHADGALSVLVTFDPHPRKVLFPEQSGLQLINTLEEKLELLASCGIDAVIVQQFTLEFSRTTALSYVRDLLVAKVKMKKLVIGYDHQFGKNREGSIEQLSEYAPLYGFQVDEIPVQEIDQVNVSSTKVRYALNDGIIGEANTYLGYKFFMTGEVVRGEGRGKQLSIPTANISVNDDDKITPKTGVYAVEVQVDGESFLGVVNIGSNPTFGENNKPSIEVHILNFDKDIYGQKIRLYFKNRIRDEKKFDSSEQLVAQIKQDIEIAKGI